MGLTENGSLINEPNSNNHEILVFLRYELRLLKLRKGDNAHSLIHSLVESAYKQFNIQTTAEEKKQLVELLANEYQKNAHLKPNTSKFYHPPFVIKENPGLIISEQSVDKAAKAFKVIHLPLMDLIDANRTSKMTRPQFSTYLKPLVTQCLRKSDVYLNAVELLVLGGVTSFL